jgi:DNA-binding winged helix-turn-helix (wHTH) protein/Tol biopolymer transport system component
LRYLQLNDICIDTDNQLLIRAGESINLAPKVYDLLVFFCLNHHRVISKDELMDQVWSGTIVTENAISRTIVKVRKALGDDPKNPQFILTVPRKGYRMVAEFIATEHATLSEAANSPSKRQAVNAPLVNHESTTAKTSNGYTQLWGKDSALKIIILTSVLLSLSMLFYSMGFQPAESITTKQIKPLTREIGEEIFPTISPDNKLLAYTKVISGKNSYINIENLDTHKKQSISHARGKISKPVWSPLTNKLAFLYQHNSVCQIYWADIDMITDHNTWQLMSECAADSEPSFMFSPDEQYLYFNDKASTTNGYQIFRVHLATSTKDIVNQPITSGKGNYSFDISPNGEQLVMLNSEFAPITRIYTLELENSRLTQTAQLPYLMRSILWHHDNKTIIHPSPHPAYDLWQSNLKGEKLAVVTSNTSRVKHVSRVNNGKDFTFVSYLLNRDIHFTSTDTANLAATEEKVASYNSSVMDYLPTLANTRQQYAFVSKRSTNAEVYIADLTDNTLEQPQQLTHFNNHVKLYHLAFSPNDSQLLIVADNQLYVAETKSLSVKQLPLENIAISGVSWLDENTILFSTIKNNDWYFMQYNINESQLLTLPAGYQGGLYSFATQSYYLLADESSKIVKLKTLNGTAQETTLTCTPSFKNRKLNLIETPSGLVCQATDQNNGFNHYTYNNNDSQAFKIPTSNVDFDINNHGVIYTQMKQSVADIMQTSSQ